MINDIDSVNLDFDVELTAIKVFRDRYEDSEEQELKFSLDSAIRSASISFELICGDDVEIVLAPDYFEKGFNTILFQMHVDDETYAEDINLSFTTNEKSFYWPGDRLIFEPIDEDDTSVVVVESFGNVRFRAVERRTFKINKEKLWEDLTLSYDGARRDGKVQVVLNGEELYDGDLKEENELILPLDKLVDGRNEVLFVLMN